MFNWLRRRVHNRHWKIFGYWDGSRLVLADPVVIYRALDADDEFEWETHPQMIDVPDDVEVSVDAMRITAKAVRIAFQIPVYDGKHGLPEGELVVLLLEFVEWMNALKKNTSPSPISPELTVLPFSGAENGPTNAESDCGSTSTESKSAEAEASSLESTPH